MRSSVYLFATALLISTALPAPAAERAIGDSAIVVYGDAYHGTAHDAAYGNPYSDRFVSSEEVIFLEEPEQRGPAAADIAPLPAEAVAALYAPESAEDMLASMTAAFFAPVVTPHAVPQGFPPAP